jgi:TonB family protein
MGRARIAAIAVGSSLTVHVGVALALSNVDLRLPGARASTIVQLEMRAPSEAPRLTEALKTPTVEPRPRTAAAHAPKRVAHAHAVHAEAPLPPPSQEPAKAEAKPVFGLNLAATAVGEGSVSVAMGETAMADPAAARTPSRPVADAIPDLSDRSGETPALQIRTLPKIDAHACGKLITYPPEAESLGIEGDVTLRVPLDAVGRAHDVRVLRGLGHGLDEVARDALTNLCTFTPAVATDGKAIAYVIPSYVFHFEIPR